MLQTFLYILAVSFTCISWGLPLVLYLQRKNPAFSFQAVIFAFFSGLAILALLSSWHVLVAALRYETLLGLTIAVVAFDIYYLSRIFKGKWNYRIPLPGPAALALVICASLLFVILGSGKPAMDDTDLYHVQIVRWNNEYGMVPGLANIYLRLGFFSNWFHLVSWFYIPRLENQNFLYLNATLSIWFVLFLVSKWRRNSFRAATVEKKILGIFYLLCLVFMFGEWDLLRANAATTTYDFIVTSLVLICISIIAENTLIKNSSSRDIPLLIMFALAVPAFKISGAPILVILFAYLWLNGYRFRQFRPYLVLAIAFALPMLIKNHVQTGYLLYPYSASGFFSPEWKVPEEMTERFSDFISLSNKYINQSVPAEAWISNGLGEWIPGWFAHLRMNDKVIVALAMLGVIASFFVFRRRDSAIRKLYPYFYLSVFFLLTWFLSAPDPRFAYPYLCFVAFIIIAFFVAPIAKPWMQKGGLLVLCAGILIYGAIKLSALAKSGNLMEPPPIEVPPHHEVTNNGTIYFMPARINKNWNPRCYDSPLPCIYQLNPYLESRGPQYKNGFRMKGFPDPVFIVQYNY